MAMCWPIFISVASTVGNVLQFKSPQPLNELIMPESAGVNGLLGGGDACTPACPAGGTPTEGCSWGDAGYARLRSACRRNRWNCSAGVSASGAVSRAAIADGPRVLPCSLKLCVSLGVPLAAWGTSRYSVADALAGNTMQPQTGPGSMA